MTPPVDDKLTDLLRDFIDRLRSHIAQQAAGTPEELAERLLGTGAAIAAAVVVFLPAKRRDGLAAALLQAALRYFGTRPRGTTVVDG